MSPMTLVQTIAEFRRAGLPVDEHYDSLCPVCRRMFSIATEDGEIALECSEGCARDDIAHALHSLALHNPDPVAPADELALSCWEPVDLLPILSGEHVQEQAEILHRSDGVGLLYRGRLHAVYGEPEACKGWLALTAAAECMETAEPVLYLDYEDTAANIVSRLLALGVDKAVIRARLSYLRVDEPVDRWAIDALTANTPALVVIDGITEALTVEGLDMAANQDIAEFRKRIARPFVRAGAAVLEVDHVVKDKENRGRYAIGAQHKLAGTDVAYKLDVVQPFGREREGLVKITVTKDRPGFVRQHSEDGERTALLRLQSDNGTVTTRLERAEEHGDSFRPTRIMERVSKAVEAQPGLTRNAVRATVQHKATYVDLALELLISEGFVTFKREGQAKLHHVVKPYRVPTESHRVPDPAGDTGSPGPPPFKGTRDPDPAATTNGTATESLDLDRAERLAAKHADLNGGQAE